jgi:hypothetical protein
MQKIKLQASGSGKGLVIKEGLLGKYFFVKSKSRYIVVYSIVDTQNVD